MKNLIKNISVLLLLAVGFSVGYFLSEKSYIIVKPNWIRGENASFTVESKDVGCEKFTVSVLGFFSETLAEDILRSPEEFGQIYSGLRLETDYPIKFIKLNESKAPFGYYANYHNTTYSVEPPFVEGEMYHVTVKVTFNKFSKIRKAVPFELDLVPSECK